VDQIRRLQKVRASYIFISTPYTVAQSYKTTLPLRPPASISLAFNRRAVYREFGFLSRLTSLLIALYLPRTVLYGFKDKRGGHVGGSSLGRLPSEL
jgi:hypothetical protein